MNLSSMQMSTKRNVLGAVIVVISIMIIGISFSYAYFVNEIEEVQPAENKGVSVTSGRLTMNFATVGDQYINANAATLINDADVLSSDMHTDFSVTLPSSATVSSANYELYLKDVVISDNFKSGYVKWALYESSNMTTPVGSGDFATAASGVNLPLKSGLSINKGDTVSYKLYVWLSNVPGEKQNSLLGGSLKAKVGFTGKTNN